MTINQDLSSDIVAWMFGLEDLADQLHGSPPVFDKEEKSEIHGEVSELLVTLNHLIIHSERENQMVFYDACGPRIDHVFSQLRKMSTFCEKEMSTLRIIGLIVRELKLESLFICSFLSFSWPVLLMYSIRTSNLEGYRLTCAPLPGNKDNLHHK